MQIIKASAGSGKTYRLAYEYIRNVIGDPYRYRSILAVTFTNKATDEMKWRILSELHAMSRNPEHGYVTMLLNDIEGLEKADIPARATKALSLILHDYSRFSVMTIDRFFQKILHAFIKELGLDSDYSIDLDYSYLLSMAADRMIDSIQEGGKSGESISAFIDESISRGKGYQSLKEDLVRFSYIIFSEEFDERALREKETVFSDFFDKMERLYTEATESYRSRAEEAVTYIKKRGLSIEDFHYRRSGFANFFFKVADGIFEDYGNRVSEALEPDAKWGKGIGREDIAFLQPILRDLCRFWDEQKKFIVTAREVLKYYRSFLLLADTSRTLDEVCRERNVLLLPATTRLLESLIAGNDAPFIYEKSGNAYEVFMIDEFQDTSRIQWKNFAPLLRNAIASAQPGKEPVTLVGDIKQAIYRWRGGDWRLLQKDIYEDLPGNAVEDSVLDTNWRSARDIVTFNNALIRNVVETAAEHLQQTLALPKASGETPDVRFHKLSGTIREAYNRMEQHCARANERGFVSVAKCDYGTEENIAKCIAIIEELQDRGYQARDISILVRTNREAQVIANRILEHRTAHPESPYNYDIVSEDALWIGNSETVRFILDCMRLSGSIAEGNDDITQARYNRFLEHRPDRPLPDTEKERLEGLRGLPPTEAFETILRMHGLGAKAGETAYVQALHEQVIRFSAQNISDIPSFLEWWEKEGRQQSINLPEGQNAIRIQTIHKSKGLEYGIVILPFLSWNLEPQGNPFIWTDTDDPYFSTLNGMPIRYSETLAESRLYYSYALEKTLSYVENINLLYVAVTRAGKELYLLLPDKARSGGSIASCIESVFHTDGKTVEIVNPHQPQLTNDIRGQITATGEYVFGEKRQNRLKASDNTACPTADHYPSADYKSRITLRSETERYDELFGQTLSPRSRGILIHKLFAGIETLDEIGPALDEMIFNGELHENMRETVREMAERALKDERLVKLFRPGWKIYNEHNILIPGSKEQGFRAQRPDRVVTDGEKAYVLDYKSGDTERESHIRQVRAYMVLLKKMGYTDVRGYVWYMSSGTVREIV